jgi:hypothetical protein
LKVLQARENKALFLAIIFIFGIISSIHPLFMEVRAESHYKIDDSDKSKYSADNYKNYKVSSSSVKNIECNNINANVNGFNGVGINALPTALRGLASDEGQAADEDEVSASSFGSDGGRPSGSETDSILVCINNNTNDVQGNILNRNEKIPEPLTCEECFIESLTKGQLDRIIIATLYLSEGELSFKEVCKILADKGNDDFLTNEDKLIIFNAIFDRANISSQVRTPIVDCLEELGILKLA